MYSQILDRETYQQVISLAPKTIGEYKNIARQAVEAMDAVETGESYEVCGETIWHISISSLAKLLESKPSPSALGRVLGELGLVKCRHRDGYHVYWTLDQLHVLVFHFGLAEVVDAD